MHFQSNYKKFVHFWKVLWQKAELNMTVFDYRFYYSVYALNVLTNNSAVRCFCLVFFTENDILRLKEFGLSFSSSLRFACLTEHLKLFSFDNPESENLFSSCIM